MIDPNSIRKFEYRPCRIATGFVVDFVAGGETLHGVCRDVSDAGIRATLDGSASVGSTGTLTLRHPAGVLELQAQVAYIEKQEVGFVFLFKSTRESTAAVKYIASVANKAAASAVVRFR